MKKNNELDNIKERYMACLILHAVGDTVGFKNGAWEFYGPGSDERTLEKLYEFIELGGINHISLKNWRVSDDTILHMYTADALTEDYNSLNTFGNYLKRNYLMAYDQFLKEGLETRAPGFATMKYLQRLKEGGKWNDAPYDLRAGGSGASMRCLCVGLAYHGEANRAKLIQFAIESSRVTHNTAVGYLGGLASALFTALAIEGKTINDWPFLLLELFNNGAILRYIKAAERDVISYDRDYHVFVDKWNRYVLDKFDDNRKPIQRRSSRNLVYRSRYYRETFGYKSQSIGQNVVEGVTVHDFIGSGGDDSVIIAYDCLLDSGNNWEKLVIYAMLHTGDTDTTGSIAAGFYGALYGFNDVPENYLDNLEYKSILTDLSNKLYDKFNV